MLGGANAHGGQDRRKGLHTSRQLLLLLPAARTLAHERDLRRQPLARQRPAAQHHKAVQQAHALRNGRNNRSVLQPHRRMAQANQQALRGMLPGKIGLALFGALEEPVRLLGVHAWVRRRPNWSFPAAHGPTHVLRPWPLVLSDAQSLISSLLGQADAQPPPAASARASMRACTTPVAPTTSMRI